MPTAERSTLRILLVEDDLIHAKLIRRALREFVDRLHIVHVPDGEAALEAMNCAPSGESEPELLAPYDLVLLDLRLPRVDGFMVLQAIRARQATRGTPVVVVSTTDRIDEIRRCYDLGANAFLVKPIVFQEIIGHVRAMMRFWLQVIGLPLAARHTVGLT